MNIGDKKNQTIHYLTLLIWGTALAFFSILPLKQNLDINSYMPALVTTLQNTMNDFISINNGINTRGELDFIVILSGLAHLFHINTAIMAFFLTECFFYSLLLISFPLLTYIAFQRKGFCAALLAPILLIFFSENYLWKYLSAEYWAYAYIIIPSFLLMLIYTQSEKQKTKIFISLIISLLCGAINIIRASAALPVMMAFALLLIFECSSSLKKNASINKTRPLLYYAAIIILIFFIGYGLKKVLVQACFLAYNIKNGSHIKFSFSGSPGPWHSLYIGLGWHQNPFGITFSDTCAYNKAQEIIPGCGYFSKEYMKALRQEWLRLFIENPFYFIKDYFFKFLYIIFNSCLDKKLLYTVPFIVFIYKYFKPRIYDKRIQFLISILVMLVLTTIPSLVTKPEVYYSLGLYAGIRFAIAIFILYGITRFEEKIPY